MLTLLACKQETLTLAKENAWFLKSEEYWGWTIEHVYTSLFWFSYDSVFWDETQLQKFKNLTQSLCQNKSDAETMKVFSILNLNTKSCLWLWEVQRNFNLVVKMCLTEKVAQLFSFFLLVSWGSWCFSFDPFFFLFFHLWPSGLYWCNPLTKVHPSIQFFPISTIWAKSFSALPLSSFFRFGHFGFPPVLVGLFLLVRFAHFGFSSRADLFSSSEIIFFLCHRVHIWKLFLSSLFGSFVTFTFFALFIIQALYVVQENSFSLFVLVDWVRIISEHVFKEIKSKSFADLSKKNN